MRICAITGVGKCMRTEKSNNNYTNEKKRMMDGIATTVVMHIAIYMDLVLYTLMGILNILMEQSNMKKRRIK
jgi:hypothetical protein